MTKAVEENRRLGTELRLLRDLYGVRGRELAGRIGISQSKVSRIESGEVLPSIAEVMAWASAVGAPQETERLLPMLKRAAQVEAENRYQPRNLAEALDIGIRQLHHRGQRIHEIGLTADDLADVADYLHELAEHGADVAHLAQRAIEDAPRQHPVLSSGERSAVQVFIPHITALMQAAQTFANSCYVLLSRRGQQDDSHQHGGGSRPTGSVSLGSDTNGRMQMGKHDRVSGDGHFPEKDIPPETDDKDNKGGGKRGK